MSNLAATAEARNWTATISDHVAGLDCRRLLWVSVALAVVIYAQFQFWKLPAGGDRANWEYFAQVIARGGTPYRDVVNIKSPFSAYIGAAAIKAGALVGLRDIYAIRLTFMALGVLIVAFTFLVAHSYFKSLRVALLAAIVMLAFNSFMTVNCAGIQPKTPMMLFGLVGLWAIEKDRPFLAGMFGMLSALSWQPGLLFVGAAVLAFSSYLTVWRDWKAAKVVAGAVAPLALQLLVLLAAGGLRDFYLWTIDFNYTVYGPRGVQSPAAFVGYIARMMRGAYRPERLYFYLAAAGFLLIAWQELKLLRRQGVARLLERAPRHALLIAPAVYVAFCAINVQGSGDMFPLLPFVAMFSGVMLVYALDQAGEIAGRWTAGRHKVLIARYGFIAAVALVFLFNVADAFLFRQKFPTLADQDAAVQEAVSHLGPGDKLFVHGQTEILVLSGLTNASKYFYLDRGKDTYLDRVEPGGFEGWFERLKAERPKVVALSRLRSVDRGRQIRDWADNEYERREGRVFSYYLRKD